MKIAPQLRIPDSNVESIALRAGYRSVSSVYQALRLQTGFRPTEVRSLSDAQLRDLLTGALALSRGGLAR